jgi:RNA polymerase subunit RPABC4/transcription elongation factor Spt4
MDFEAILSTIQPFVIMFAALFAAFLTAVWVSVIIWAFRDIRARSRDIFAQILATLMVLLFFPLFPFPGLILYLLLRPRETLSEIYERSLEEEALLQGIEERMACPGCNRRIEEQFMVCPTCHTRLKKACPACGRLLHLRWNICPFCSAVQTTTKVAALPDTQRVALPVEPPVEAPKLAETVPSGVPQSTSQTQPAAIWEESLPPYEPEAEAAYEADTMAEAGDAGHEPEVGPAFAPEPEVVDEVDKDSEPDQASSADEALSSDDASSTDEDSSVDEDSTSSEDAEPYAETLPFEFD